jgi:acetyl-CoA acyltransferase
MREVAIIAARRTAVGKAKKGSFKDTRPDDMLAPVLKAVVEQSAVDPATIGDVVIGTATPEAEQGMNIGRIAALMAGVPESVPAMTINRFCSSGLQSLV